MELLTHPIILLILIPLVAGGICLIIPKSLKRLLPYLAVAGSAITLLYAWKLFCSPPEIVNFQAWLSLRLDTLSSFVLLATALFGLLIALYSIGYMKGKKYLRRYYTYLLWTLGISCAAILANDLILLLCLWGFLGLTLYVLIGVNGPDAAGAAKKSFFIIGGSDSVLLLGIAIIWVLSGTTRMDGLTLHFTGPLIYVAFFSFVVAAFAKAGAIPLHTWFPIAVRKPPCPLPLTCQLPWINF